MAAFIQSLKILKPSLKNKQNSFQLERVTRNKILKKILDMQPIIEDIEQISYEHYTYSISGEQTTRRNTLVLENFIKLYESKINKKMDEKNAERNKELQEKAMTLGGSIAYKMIKYNDNPVQVNVRQSRKYILDARNSRTYESFLTALERIQIRYDMEYGFKEEFANEINESNYKVYKSFLVFAMLNRLNYELRPKKADTQNTSSNS